MTYGITMHHALTRCTHNPSHQQPPQAKHHDLLSTACDIASHTRSYALGFEGGGGKGAPSPPPCGTGVPYTYPPGGAVYG